jgi:fatty-acyl-CoA synthase
MSERSFWCNQALEMVMWSKNMKGEKEITLGEILDKAAAEDLSRECIVFENMRISYGEFREKVNRMARGLLALGIKKGDNVALWMTNRPEWLIAGMALVKIGAVLVPVSTRFKAMELEAILKGSDAAALVMMDCFEHFDYLDILDEACAGQATSKFPNLRNVICLASKEKRDRHLSFVDVMEIKSKEVSSQQLEKAQARCDPEDVINIFFTSGTTGYPKGAMLTHHGVGKNARNVGRLMHLGPEDRLYLAVPLFNVYGWIDVTLAAFNHGSTLILDETFHPEESLIKIRDEKCTVLYGGDTMWVMWLQSENIKKIRFSTLRTALAGAAEHRPSSHLDAIMNLFGFEWVHTLYGLSETSAAATMTRSEDPIDYLYKSAGRAMPDVEVTVADPDTGKTLPPGETGEILVRGFTVMKGYYNRPEETDKAIDADGWFHTGDFGEIDAAGNLKFKGRVKGERFKSGGNNVYCREVEQFFCSHPKVKQAVLIGVPDKKMREVGMIFLELNKGECATDEEMIGFCRGKIASYKIPKYLKFTEEFPMTANLKIQKYKLREDAIKALGFEE